MDMREHYRELKKQGVHGADILDATAKSLVNSVYGIIGSTAFRLFDRDKALFITSTGQDINRYIQSLCQDKQHLTIKYGDSIASDTTLKIYDEHKNFKYVKIEELFNSIDVTSIDGKEYSMLNNTYVESIDENGKVILDKIKCVMRHKCNKLMYRINNGNCYIDVTEDHSICGLLDETVVDVKPTQLLEHHIKLITLQYNKLHYINNYEVIPISYDGYVYDLTTETTHRFFANNILCHNTDSVFVSQIHNGQEALELEHYLNTELIKWSKEHGSTVNFQLKAEKVFKTLMFKPKASNRTESGKKKYAGHLIWKEGEDLDELAYMGLELKRSDNSIATKQCLQEFLDCAILKNDVDGAIKVVKTSYRNIKKGNVNPYDISLPKEVRKLDYDGKNSWVNGINYARQEYQHAIGEGIKPRLLYLKHGVICIDDTFDTSLIKDDIDYVTMANTTIKKKLESYLWALDLDWNFVIKGQQDISKWM
jgi:DNA polymerase I